MGWCTTSNLDEFLAAAGDYLRAKPAETAQLLAAAQETRESPQADAVFGWFETREGVIRGAFLNAPPAPMILAGITPEVAVSLVGTLAPQPNSVRGVQANAAAADAFAAAWTRRTGTTARTQQHSRLFRLVGKVPDLEGPEGRSRVAGDCDRANLVEWLADFARETGELASAPEATADDLLSYGGATFWEDCSKPVSLATVTRPVANMVRISIIYTPPEFRHRGYAPAVVTAVSQAAIDGGADEVLLIAGLASPINSTLRQRLGFEPAGERVVLSFTPAR